MRVWILKQVFLLLNVVVACELAGCTANKTFLVTSEPPGLRVHKGGAVLGKTPLELRAGAGDFLFCTPSYWSFALEIEAPAIDERPQERIINPCEVPNKANIHFRFHSGMATAPVPHQENSNRPASDIDKLPAPKMQRNKNAYAIVVGVEKYRQKLPTADFAERDATSMAEYLTKVLGYPEENIVVLLNENATKGDLEKYFEKWLGNNVTSNDVVFVYFSGHGSPDPQSGAPYLVPYEGDPAFIAQTGYSLDRMYEALGKLPAKNVVIALDTCFSGGGARSITTKGTRPLVTTVMRPHVPDTISVLAASAENQLSTTFDENGHGLFTYFLLKGIKETDVVGADGTIRVDSLFDYLKPQVEKLARSKYNVEQTPQLFGFRGGREQR